MCDLPAMESKVGDAADGSSSSAKHARIESKTQRLQFAFAPQPAKREFCPLYSGEPSVSTASVNAGDYRLYVGGGSINRGFGELFKEEQGLVFGKTCKPYAKHHQAMLHQSLATDGAIVLAPAASDIKLVAALGQAGEKFDSDTPGSEGATGAVFLDVFEEVARPLADKNVAMLYVVGPKGEDCAGPKGQGTGPMLNKDLFVAAVERLGRSAMELVAQYNQRVENGELASLPRIDDVRWCLVSGGVYRHREVSKVDVARATLRGMLSVRGDFTVTCAYDEDAFKQAAELEGL